MWTRFSASSPILLLVAFQTLSLSADRLPTRQYDTNEAYKVYSAILNSLYSTSSPNQVELVIEGETEDLRDGLGSSLDYCFPKSEDLRVSDWATLLELRKQSARPEILDREFVTVESYKILPRDAIVSLITGRGILWEEFGRRFPKSGIVSFSPVGFNESRDRALVYFSFSCGLLCGGAHFYTLEKRHGTWKFSEPAANCEILH